MGCSSPLLSPWVHRWINHLWRVASAMPDLRLPSQSQDIAALRLIPNYTAWWQRYMCVNNLPKVVTWQRNGQELNMWPLESLVSAHHYTTRPHAIIFAFIIIIIIIITITIIEWCLVFIVAALGLGVGPEAPDLVSVLKSWSWPWFYCTCAVITNWWFQVCIASR